MPASLSSKLSIRDVQLKDKKVVMRVDFNVPFDGEGNITNNQVRPRSSCPFLPSAPVPALPCATLARPGELSSQLHRNDERTAR